MVAVRPCSLADADEMAAVIASAFGRASDPADVRFRLLLQPNGWRIAHIDGTAVGVGGLTRFGQHAVIGLMATRPQFQRRGVATAILRELLALADEWGLSTASLYATASGAQLYRDHGFVDIAPATLWERDVIMRSPPRSALSPLTRTSWDAAAALDARLVGVPRHRLLRWLLRDNPGRCFQVSATDGPMLGYVVAQRGRIGPAVATSSDAMTALLDAALSLEFREPVTIIVPAENGVAADLLNERGFAPRRTTWHMMRGATGAHGHPSRMLALASFGLG